MKVLLVEDDQMIGEGVRDALCDKGLSASWARSGWEASGMLSVETFDMVLLDIGLPGRNGMEVLRDLRARDRSTPVIIITARDSLEDRLAGLDAGADDYVLKPFHMSELLARMRAVGRRRSLVEDDAAEAGRTLTNGVVTLDLETKAATVAGPSGQGAPVPLSKREFDLLEALLERPGAIKSRSDLEDRVYPDNLPESNALEFIIHGLRKKLGSKVIRNVRGLGWMVQKKQ